VSNWEYNKQNNFCWKCTAYYVTILTYLCKLKKKNGTVLSGPRSVATVFWTVTSCQLVNSYQLDLSKYQLSAQFF